MVTVAFCPIEKEFCKNKVIAYGSEHIPLVVGAEHGSFENPNFKVEGSNINDVNKNFDILHSMVKKARSNRSRQQQETIIQQEAPAKQEEIPGGQYDMQATQKAIDAVMSMAVSPSHRPAIPISLCTPGIDCSNEVFEDRAIQYMLSGASERKKRNMV
jgi:hypothetical protein